MALRLSPPAAAQTLVQAAPARLQITAPVNNAKRTVLQGNLRPEARAPNDRGAVPDALPMPHLQLLLTRPAEREAALVGAIKDLHDLVSLHDLPYDVAVGGNPAIRRAST